MSLLGNLFRLRAREDAPEWPRARRGARADERRWIDSLDDRELAQLAASLAQVDRAVKNFREPPTEPEQKDAP